MVECINCGWSGNMPELDSEVEKLGLEKVSRCPSCGAKSSNDDLKIEGQIP